jgi:hypothetical protein
LSQLSFHAGGHFLDLFINIFEFYLFEYYLFTPVPFVFYLLDGGVGIFGFQKLCLCKCLFGSSERFSLGLFGEFCLGRWHRYPVVAAAAKLWPCLGSFP